MKFPSQEFSGVEQIISQENESFTDELSVIVLKENFINCYQVEEINGISLKDLDYEEGSSKVQLSQVVKKLVYLGYDFQNYQVFYKAKNLCFVYVGVFPCLSDVYVPFLLPRKIIVKFCQSLQCNNEDYILPYSIAEQN